VLEQHSLQPKVCALLQLQRKVCEETGWAAVLVLFEAVDPHDQIVTTFVPMLQEDGI
jgi:hypothetical protein